MTDPVLGTPKFKIGDRVRIRYVSNWRGPIVEWRGPLAPGGVQVYRIRIQKRPTEEFTEASEDQLILLRPKAERAVRVDPAPADGPPPTATGA